MRTSAPADQRASPAEAVTRNGRVRGLQQAGIFSFKGIPYAAPIEGINRWIAPQPPGELTGSFDATEYGPSAPQFTPTVPNWILPKAGAAMLNLVSVVPPAPNCLSVNVWTPNLGDENQGDAAQAKLPVMFWIHGGGLASGSSNTRSTDGAALAKQGAVVVSVNYRLGGLGFLAANGLFDDDVCIGNRGFMDLVAGLQWVRDNISQLGGDPENVTIFGQSAGGTCVWALLASPATVGLFHRAIVMSGPIVMIDIADHHKYTRDVLKAMNVPVGDVQALANAPNDIVVGTKMQTMLYRRGEPYGEMSTVRLPAAGAYHTEFMPDDVLDALANARSRNIDLLVGNCKHDGRVAVAPMPLPNTIAIRVANSMFNGLVGDTKAQRKAILAKYKTAMPGAGTYTILEQIQSDALYRIRSIKAAEIHSQKSTGRTYMYEFDWESPAFNGAFGAFHGFDAAFAFNNLSALGQCLGSAQDVQEAQPLADAISAAWVAFARTGTPYSTALPEWPQYEFERRQTMVFDRRCAIVDDPGQQRRKIWLQTEQHSIHPTREQGN